MKQLISRVGAFAGGVLVLIAVVALANVSFFVTEGDPRIPQLEKTWWAGYYDTHTFGKQWCVAVFERDSSGGRRMALLSSAGAPDVFTISRSETSGGQFITLSLREVGGTIKIDAQQLFEGKRYFLGRLFAGRFRDFWRRNDDIAIRGQIVSVSPPTEFAIEPITPQALTKFWRTYVRTDSSATSPEELLAAVSVRAPTPVR